MTTRSENDDSSYLVSLLSLINDMNVFAKLNRQLVLKR